VHCAALNEALTAEVHRLKLATGEVTADGNGMPKSLQQQMNSQMVQLQQLQSTQGQQGEQQQQPQKSA
jgi:hypothetical protein